MWIDRKTFERLDAFDRQFFYSEKFNPNWINEVLETSSYPETYEYFFSGAEIMQRCNSEGYLELLMLINDVNPIKLAKAKLGVKIIECEDNRFVFHLMIWDQEDSPLEIPFIFKLYDDIHRYRLAALCEQESITLYFLNSNGGTLNVSFARELQFSEQMRVNLRESVVQAYEPQELDKDYNSTNDGEEAIIASTIDLEELAANGWAYQFDLLKVEEKFGKDGIKNYLHHLISDMSYLLNNSKYKGVQRGPFYFWFTQKDFVHGASGERGSALILIVSPFYYERATRARNEVEPVYDFIKNCPGFIRVESGNPIFENALPLSQYAESELVRIEVDREFLESAAAYQDYILRINGIESSNYFSVYRSFLEGN